MSRWNYKLLNPQSHTSTSIQHELNKLGADGWELLEKQWGNYWIFKRPYDPHYSEETIPSAVQPVDG